jgi:hypothetical protein
MTTVTGQEAAEIVATVTKWLDGASEPLRVEITKSKTGVSASAFALKSEPPTKS